MRGLGIIFIGLFLAVNKLNSSLVHEIVTISDVNISAGGSKGLTDGGKSKVLSEPPRLSDV